MFANKLHDFVDVNLKTGEALIYVHSTQLETLKQSIPKSRLEFIQLVHVADKILVKRLKQAHTVQDGATLSEVHGLCRPA